MIPGSLAAALPLLDGLSSHLPLLVEPGAQSLAAQTSALVSTVATSRALLIPAQYPVASPAPLLGFAERALRLRDVPPQV
jgi:hypothetical protein